MQSFLLFYTTKQVKQNSDGCLVLLYIIEYLNRFHAPEYWICSPCGSKNKTRHVFEEDIDSCSVSDPIT